MTTGAAAYGAIVLAAGASRRMGEGRNKLLEAIEGRAIVARVVDAFLEAGTRRVVVVVGYEAARVRDALAGRDRVEFVPNPDWSDGMGHSLAAGARAWLADGGTDAPGVFVAVGDLPGLASDVIEALCAAHATSSSPRAIFVPTHAGRDGHPVLFGRAHLPALAALGGDRGARSIVEANAAHVHRVPVDTDRILRDVDTPDELTRARVEARSGSPGAAGDDD